jgi:hypothetical protein
MGPTADHCRALRIANPLTFALTATVNALGGAGVFGAFAMQHVARPRPAHSRGLRGGSRRLCARGRGGTGEGVGNVSDANPTELTPASFAFSIWAFIYSLLALFCVYSASAEVGGGAGSRLAALHHAPLIRFIPVSLRYSVRPFLNRQCDRTLGRGRVFAHRLRAAAGRGPASRGRVRH